MTQTATMTRHMTRSINHVDRILPDRRDDAADKATIKLLHEVTARRAQLRALEPQLSKMITDYGLRRGQTGYREFYLRSELNAKQYTERAHDQG
jgi:hypothetical protein